jgi:hypothetical protein
MSRATYVIRDGELVEKHLAAPLHDGSAAPFVRVDGMDAVKSMADGKVYDSKSAYYASVRRAGCEIVGDDRGGFGPRPEYRPQNIGQDIKRSIEQLRAGYRD